MRGPKKNADQIKDLVDKLGSEGTIRVDSLIENYSVDEITLAYKLTRVAAKKLPKTVTNLVDLLPEEKAAEVREALLSVK